MTSVVNHMMTQALLFLALPLASFPPLFAMSTAFPTALRDSDFFAGALSLPAREFPLGGRLLLVPGLSVLGVMSSFAFTGVLDTSGEK